MAKRATRINWTDVRRYALDGARARLLDLRAEMSKILSTFPQLGTDDSAARRSPRTARGGNAPAAAPRPRRRRTMSAAERKAVSDRMRKYWAARRGAGPAAPQGKPAAKARGTRKNPASVNRPAKRQARRAAKVRRRKSS